MNKQKGTDNYYLDIDLIDYLKVCEEKGRVTRNSLIKHESNKPGALGLNKQLPQKGSLSQLNNQTHPQKPHKPNKQQNVGFQKDQDQDKDKQIGQKIQPKQKRKGRPRKPKEEIKIVEEQIHSSSELSIISSSSSSELISSESSASIKKKKEVFSSSEEEFSLGEEQLSKQAKKGDDEKKDHSKLKKEAKALNKIIKKEDSLSKLPTVTTRLQLQSIQIQPVDTLKSKKQPIKSNLKKKVKTNEEAEQEQSQKSSESQVEIKQEIFLEQLPLEIQVKDNLFGILNECEFYVKDFLQFPIKHLKQRTVKLFKHTENNHFIVKNGKIKKQYKRIQNKLEIEFFGQHRDNNEEQTDILNTASDPMLIMQEAAFMQINEYKFKQIWQNSLKDTLRWNEFHMDDKVIGYWPVCILSNLSENNEVLQGRLKLWDDLEIKVQQKQHKLKKLVIGNEEKMVEVCLEARKKKRIVQSMPEEKDQIMDISRRLELDRAEIFEDESSDKIDLEIDNILDQTNNQEEIDESTTNANKFLVWFIGTSYYELVLENSLKKVEQIDQSKLKERYNSNKYLRSVLNQYNELTRDCNSAIRLNEKVLIRGDYMQKMIHQICYLGKIEKGGNDLFQQPRNFFVVLNAKNKGDNWYLLIKHLHNLETEWLEINQNQSGGIDKTNVLSQCEQGILWVMEKYGGEQEGLYVYQLLSDLNYPQLSYNSLLNGFEDIHGYYSEQIRESRGKKSNVDMTSYSIRTLLDKFYLKQFTFSAIAKSDDLQNELNVETSFVKINFIYNVFLENKLTQDMGKNGGVQIALYVGFASGKEKMNLLHVGSAIESFIEDALPLKQKSWEIQ